MRKGDSLDQFLLDLGNQCYRLLIAKGASPHEAEDVVQEAYYKLIKIVPELKESQIKAWFFRVALNQFIDEKRKIKRLVLVEQTFFDDHPKKMDDYQRIVDLDQIECQLESVKPEYQEILILKYYYGLSYLEISDILEIKPDSVKQKLARARKSAIKERNDGDGTQF
ncbi:RNA polymerase sigma factor [Vagococcus hydrophili]|uniref:RNA polymerase sigma factor n=1 Tax=Vagococcus hydrophili TaxID=2714947 RepID=A0A6G8AUH6_9ENTE|nr:RNA polymerase sigma factor [Vagococcus hydrophili]QIL48595.1 RNA polymerase sigma factor [Vagococcus hydrophili]